MLLTKFGKNPIKHVEEEADCEKKKEERKKERKKEERKKKRQDPSKLDVTA